MFAASFDETRRPPMTEFFKRNAAVSFLVNGVERLECVSIIELHTQVHQDHGELTRINETISIMIVIGKDQEQKRFIGQGITKRSKLAGGVNAHSDRQYSHNAHERSSINSPLPHLRQGQDTDGDVQETTSPHESENVKVARDNVSQMRSNAEGMRGHPATIKDHDQSGHENDAQVQDNGMGLKGIFLVHKKGHNGDSHLRDGAQKGRNSQKDGSFFGFKLPLHQVSVEETVQMRLCHVVFRIHHVVGIRTFFLGSCGGFL
mmetsp:Transcript_26462/g.55349  ORF Transcript_26462/g.55349 Transcript_26462/m.55349 type:complete len:261 (-) Transcript_26462:428-1210(-)